MIGLIGCGSSDGSADSTQSGTSGTASDTQSPQAQEKTIVADAASDYAIIRGMDASEMEIAAAKRLRTAITDLTGVELPFTDDWVPDTSVLEKPAFEIVVGQTNRVQSTKAIAEDLRERDFGIYFENDRVTVVGGCAEATLRGVDYFIENHIDAESKTISFADGFSYIGLYDYAFGDVKVEGIALQDYTIVVPQGSSLIERSAADALNDYFMSSGSFTLDVVDDTTEQGAHEILIGATSRPQSVKFDGLTYADFEYLLDEEDGHIVMRGNGYMLGGAVGTFTSLITPEENGAPIDADIPSDDIVGTFVFPEKATSGILLIGDGMGYNSINAALYAGLEGFVARDFPYQGESITYSANSSITDSAAGGTALSSGYKTNNGYVGMTPDEQIMPNVREFAADAGAFTAVITTDAITGATPGAFTAHVISREETTLIEKQQLALEDISYMEGSVDDKLVDHSRKALRILTDDEANGFFIMIEEGYIDKNAHGNDMAGVVETVTRFNDLIAYCSQFVFIYPETALVITADHETGGITERDDGKGYRFTTGDHTGVNVPISAIGPGTEFFGGDPVENVEVAKFFARIWGEENLGG